jgi:hypothetical protein
MPLDQTKAERQPAPSQTRLNFPGVMAAGYPRLRAYLGDVKFTALSDAYFAALPSTVPNASFYWNGFPAFIGGPQSPMLRDELAEFASLENALRHALEIEPEASDHAAPLNQLHPSAQLLQMKNNTLSLWSAMVAGELPPKPEALIAPVDVLVWRQGTAARFRMIGHEELMALKVAAAGKDTMFFPAWRESGLVA